MSARPVRVLIVDDEAQIRRLLRVGLVTQGYDCVEAETAAEALAVCAKERPDVVILDLGLPDQDGTSVIGALRQNSLVPIVVLSAEAQVERKLAALDLGADDYITKPFDMVELLARLKAALRHGLQSKGEAPVFHSGALAVDLVSRRVFLGSEEVHLTPKEYELLRHLVANAGKVVTHQKILREVWGPANTDDIQYLRVLMRQLRQKIEPDTASQQLIATEQGVGYRLLLIDTTA
jgi:two-component system KDP operon response regulator KdpE